MAVQDNEVDRERAGGELEQPLIRNNNYSQVDAPSQSQSLSSLYSVAPSSNPSAARILDRDGTFFQSRGRWSVSNTTGAASHGHGHGSYGVSNSGTTAAAAARQRRHARHDKDAAAGAGGGAKASYNGSSTSTTTSAAAFSATTTSTNRLHHSPQPTNLWNRFCCFCSSRHTTLRTNCCSTQPTLTRRCWDDWFHSLSYTPTCFLMGGVFVAYFVTIVVFAGLYLTVNKVGVEYFNDSGANDGGPVYVGMVDGLSLESGEVASFCGMDVNNFQEAMYFSLSTMATIGYGVSDYYFGNCWTPFILVLLQVFSALIFSSLAIGLLFQRMSRGQKRGRTIVFSDVAVIRKVRGVWYWMFRVAELRKRHIIGAKVRVFCVRHERCPLTTAGTDESATAGTKIGGEGASDDVMELETAYFVSHPLPLLNGSHSATNSSPQDGGTASFGNANNLDTSFEQSILMGLPHVVVHRMDSLSPMMPARPVWYDEDGVPHGPSLAAQRNGAANNATSTLLTESEVSTESTRDEEGYPTNTTPTTLMASALEEGHPTTSALRPTVASNSNMPSQDEITHFLQDRQAEIIIFLEGTCEITGMALQARHSYRMEDIAFHETFAPCVFPAVVPTPSRSGRWNFFRQPKSKVDTTDATREQKMGGGDGVSLPLHSPQSTALEIDFCEFHGLVPAPYDSMSCPYVPSSSRS